MQTCSDIAEGAEGRMPGLGGDRDQPIPLEDQNVGRDARLELAAAPPALRDLSIAVFE